MSKVQTRPPPNDLYETDFYAWTQERAGLLRERRWGALDLDNLVDEVSSVGSSEKRELRNRLIRLLAHLLKWKYQPGRRGNSWVSAILDQRRQLADILKQSPNLQNYFRERVGERYLGGRLDAAKATGIAFGLFPEESPFTPEQVLDVDFFPEDRSIE